MLDSDLREIQCVSCHEPTWLTHPWIDSNDPSTRLCESCWATKQWFEEIDEQARPEVSA